MKPVYQGYGASCAHMNSVRLGLNIDSLKAQGRLAKSSSELASTFERLSSGQRINRASDDAAGLAIASGLRIGNAVFTQGVRNLNDGLSLLSIAESTIGQLSSVVTRIRELAQQSANGTLSSTQRKSLDTEAQELAAEFFRISRSSTFNRINLFDGSLSSGIRFQGGFGVNGSVFSQLGGALGTGTFGGTITTNLSTNGSDTAVGDLNGDGIPDTVVAQSNTNNVAILLGNGDGTFTSQGAVTAGTAPQSVTLGDLNGDGILDIVAGNRNSNNLSVLLGNGDGTFSAAGSLSTGSQPTDVALGDLNGDGVLDILSADRGSNALSIFIGNGDGTFSAQTTLATGTAPAAITLGDLNGDGILDAIAANGSSSNLSVFLGNGDGSFTSQGTIAVGSSPGSVALGDLNGDGILDAVAASAGTNTLAILLGDGDGTFTSGGTLATGSNPGSVALGDLNGDGVLDVVSTNSGSDSISVFLGDGDGRNFSSQSVIATGDAPRALNLADLNGDGVLDIFISNNLDNNLAAFLSINRDGIAPLLDFSLATKAGALQAISLLDNKLAQLGVQQGVVGAFQSRLSSAVVTLSSQADNYAAAEGRIQDADVAQEVASLTRLNTVRDAAAAILAQANQQPQLALLLLANERA